MNRHNYRVDEKILNHWQADKFHTFYSYLNKNPKHIKIIYRGENYSNLKDKLNLYGDKDYNKLNQYIFLIGEKGRAYREEYKNKIINKNKIYSIDSVEKNLFNKIFDKFHKLFLTSKKPEIESFKSLHPKFSEYFKNKVNNKSDFIEKIELVCNNNEKIKIRDYYLSLLHTIGTSGFYNNSFFTSTSTNYDIAKDFAENPNCGEKIIIVSWVKYAIYKEGITFNYLNLNKSKLNQIGLPTYNKSFFPGQNEISIKGGLLPHFILGYIRVKDNIFEINPNFFSTTKNLKDIVLDGFDINQSGFQQALNSTDYSGFFMLDYNNEYTDINF